MFPGETFLRPRTGTKRVEVGNAPGEISLFRNMKSVGTPIPLYREISLVHHPWEEFPTPMFGFIQRWRKRQRDFGRLNFR